MGEWAVGVRGWWVWGDQIGSYTLLLNVPHGSSKYLLPAISVPPVARGHEKQPRLNITLHFLRLSETTCPPLIIQKVAFPSTPSSIFTKTMSCCLFSYTGGQPEGQNSSFRLRMRRWEGLMCVCRVGESHSLHLHCHSLNCLLTKATTLQSILVIVLSDIESSVSQFPLFK